MSYSQLKKRIEQEKRQFQNSLKQLQSINSNAKVYLPYEAKNTNSAVKATHETKQQDKKVVTTPPNTQFVIQDQLISKLKQITEIKREDKITKLTSEIQHYRKKNNLMSCQLTELKQLLDQKDKELFIIESSCRQKLSRSAQRQFKLEQQELNLKAIIKDLNSALQQKERDIARLEGQVYELTRQREGRSSQILKLTESNVELREQKQNLENDLSQIKESITNFIDTVVNKINLFSEPILKIIQLKTQVIDRGQFVLFFEETQAKIKAMKENNQHSHVQLIGLKAEIEKRQIQQSDLQNKLQQLQKRVSLKEQELISKVLALQALEQKYQLLLRQNEESKRKNYLRNQQTAQKQRLNQEKEVSLTKKLEFLEQNLSSTEGQLLLCRNKELKTSQNLHKYQQETQRIKALLQDLQSKLNQSIKQNGEQIYQLNEQNHKNLRILNEEQQLNRQLSQQVQSLTQQLRQKQESLQNQAQKLKQVEASHKKLAEQNEKELHQCILLNAELEKSKKECKNYQGRNLELQTKTKGLENENQQLKYQNEKLDIQYKSLIQQLREKEKQIQQLQAQLSQKTKGFNELNLKIQQLSGQITSSHQRQSDLSLEIQRLKQEINQLTQKINSLQVQKDQKVSPQTKNDQDERVQKQEASTYQIESSEKMLKQMKNEIQKGFVLSLISKYNQAFCKNGETAVKNQDYESYTSICKQLMEIIDQCSNLSQQKQRFQEQKKHYLKQKELQKTNQKKVEAHSQLLEAKIAELLISVDQKNAQLAKRGIQIGHLREEIQQKMNQIGKISQKQEKELLISRLANDLHFKRLYQFISRIKQNCLKNNCDSVGIISFELSQVLGVDYKNVEMLSSPTDFQRFNKIDQIDAVEEFQLNSHQQQPENKPAPQQASLEQTHRKIEKKNTEDMENVRLQSSKMSKDLKKDCKVKSAQMIEQEQQKQAKSGSKQAFSIENNADVPEIVLPYPQLLQKYRDLKSDLQRMQQYICHVHSVNFKIKKGMQETDQHTRHHSIDRLTQKLALLVKHNQAFLKAETQQFTNEIGKILGEIQNYIHFIDQISKLQPFTHNEYNKTHNKFNKLKRKVTQHAKLQKQGVQKYAYSQGDSREDDLGDHFDGYFYQQDQDFPNIDSQPKEIGKKEQQGMQKYFEENRELYSEISSVKNKSLKSHNSFFNSRSQLWLGAYLKNKLVDEFQEHEHQAIKKQSNDSERLSQMSIKEIKSKYHKLKKTNRSLNKEKANLEKHCKKLETQEHDYKRKIAKMTKEFNESFKFLCQISGRAAHKQKPKMSISIQKQPQMDSIVSPRVLKICRFLESDEVIKKPEQQGKSKQKGMKELQIQNEALKAKIRQLQQKFSETEKVGYARIHYLETKLKKNEEEFAYFLKKSISKAGAQTQHERIPQRIVFQKDKAFRKNSSSFKEVQLSITPPREDPISLADIYQLLSKLFKMEKTPQVAEKLNMKQFQEILARSVETIKKSTYLELLPLILQHLPKFMYVFSPEESVSQLDKLYEKLCDYFGLNQHVNELFVLLKDLVPIRKKEGDMEVGNLSVHSQCEDTQKASFNDKGVQKERQSQPLEQQKASKIAELSRQLELHQQQNAQLEGQLDTYCLKMEEKNQLIQLQGDQYTKTMLKIEQEREELLSENKRLRQQLERCKPRARKTKIYQIGY